MQKIWGNIDFLLVVVLVVGGIYIVAFKPWGLDDSSSSALAGAIFGGAAVLLGNGINRQYEHSKASQSAKSRVEKLKRLIATELLTVAAGLVPSKKFFDSASLSSSGNNKLEINRYRPRAMPITDKLSVELLEFEIDALEALAAFRADLAVTHQLMDEYTDSSILRYFDVGRLARGVGHNLQVLADVFDRIAPDRKVAFDGQPPQLVTEWLRNAINPSDSSRAFE